VPLTLFRSPAEEPNKVSKSLRQYFTYDSSVVTAVDADVILTFVLSTAVAYPGFCEHLGDGSPPAGSRGRAPGGGLAASPHKGQQFLQKLVKFEAYIIGNLRAGGVRCRSGSPV